MSAEHRIEATTLVDLMLRTADASPDAPLLIFPDSRHSYADMTAAARAHARSLTGLGVGAGDHVGILMPNCPEYIELLLGITCIGAVAVPVNARYRAAELAYVIENADLVGIVTHDLASEYVDFAALLQAALPGLADGEPAGQTLEAAPRLRFAAMLGESRPRGLVTRADWDAAGGAIDDALIEHRRCAVRVRDVCIMMYTSGTTAHPKGCPLSHEALVRNGINMNRERYFLNGDDRFFSPLPMFHMASLLPLTACMDAGAALLSMNRVEPGEALALMERERATIAFPSFPTIMNDLITHPRFAHTDLSTVRRLNNVAPIEMLRRFQEAMPQAVQTGAYGLTEAGGVIAFNHPDEDLETRLSTCGQPFPGIDVKIVDPDTLDELPPGERGEILIRGYCLFEGYYRAPDKNAEALVDGWLRTGDLCSVDAERRISFHGRIKDMLKVGGENVAAVEIESFLAGHPAVKLAQVVGVPDERLLEVAAAFIELAPGATLSEDELIAWCKGRIASFKVPRHVRFVTDWPMSSTKVQKYRLQQMFAEERAAAGG